MTKSDQTSIVFLRNFRSSISEFIVTLDIPMFSDHKVKVISLPPSLYMPGSKSAPSLVFLEQPLNELMNVKNRT